MFCAKSFDDLQFAELASVNLFNMQYQLREKNRRCGREIPDFAFVCLPYSHLHTGRHCLSKEAVRKKIAQGIHGDRWLRRLITRERKFDELFIPYT